MKSFCMLSYLWQFVHKSYVRCQNSNLNSGVKSIQEKARSLNATEARIAKLDFLFLLSDEIFVPVLQRKCDHWMCLYPLCLDMVLREERDQGDGILLSPDMFERHSKICW